MTGGQRMVRMRRRLWASEAERERLQSSRDDAWDRVRRLEARVEELEAERCPAD